MVTLDAPTMAGMDLDGEGQVVEGRALGRWSDGVWNGGRTDVEYYEPYDDSCVAKLGLPFDHSLSIW